MDATALGRTLIHEHLYADMRASLARTATPELAVKASS